MTEGADGLTEKAVFGFRLCLARQPNMNETEKLVALYQKAWRRFENEPHKAAALIRHSRLDSAKLPDTQLAAWIVVANMILNLDETLTKG
jgi:hypothetical protein